MQLDVLAANAVAQSGLAGLNMYPVFRRQKSKQRPTPTVGVVIKWDTLRQKMGQDLRTTFVTQTIQVGG